MIIWLFFAPTEFVNEVNSKMVLATGPLPAGVDSGL